MSFLSLVSEHGDVRKGGAEGTFSTLEEAEAAALALAQQIVDSLQTSPPLDRKRHA
jgi:hypothetical protein